MAEGPLRTVDSRLSFEHSERCAGCRITSLGQAGGNFAP